MELNVLKKMHMQGIADFPKVGETIGLADRDALLSFMKLEPKPIDCLSSEALIKRAENWAGIISQLEPHETLELRVLKRQESDYGFFDQQVTAKQPEQAILANHALRRFGFELHFDYPAYLNLRSDMYYTEPASNSLIRELMQNKLAINEAARERARIQRFLRRLRRLRRELSRDFEIELPLRTELVRLFDSYYGLRRQFSGKEVRNSHFNQDLLEGGMLDIGPAGVHNGNRHGIIIELSDFKTGKKIPAEGFQGFWTDNSHPWLELPFNLDVIYRYRRRPTELALDNLHKETRRAKRQKDEALGRRQLQELKSRKGGIDSKEDELEKGDEVEEMVSFDVVLADQDLDRLDDQVQQVQRAFVEGGSKGEVLSGITALLKWLKLAPGAEMNNAKPVRGKHTAAFAYFTGSNPFSHHQRGVPILVKTDKGFSPAVFNRWQSGFLNRHIRIDGQSGAGKTLLAHMFIEHDVNLGVRYVVVDLADSFERRASLVRTGFYLDAGTKHFLDFLNIFNYASGNDQASRDFCLDTNFNFLLDMLGRKPSTDDHEKISKIIITEPQETLVMQALLAFYEQAQPHQMYLREFYEFLRDEEKPALDKIFVSDDDRRFKTDCVRVIYKYLNFPYLREYFDPSNKNTLPLQNLEESDFAVWGLKEVRNNEAIKPLYMNPLLALAYKRLFSKEKTGIFTDEGHAAASEAMLAKLLNGIIRMGRQNDMAFMFASHELIQGDSQLALALRLPQFIVLAPHARGQLDDLIKNCKLSDEQRRVLDACDPTQHEYCLLIDRMAYCIRLRLDEDAMSIYETDPDNVRNIRPIWDKHENKFDALEELKQTKWKVN